MLRTPTSRRRPSSRRRTKPVRYEVDTSEPKSKRMCYQLMQQMNRQKYAYFFDRPVDHVALGIPDYPTIIKQPMDLGTIQKKLTSGIYEDAHAFAEDVRLTWRNAITYNPPTNEVHQCALKMSQMFEVGFAKVAAEMASAELKVKNTKAKKKRLKTGGSRPNVKPSSAHEEVMLMRRKLRELESQLQQKVNRTQYLQKRRNDRKNNVLTQHEKSKLKAAIERMLPSQLDGGLPSQLDGVLSIVNPNFDWDEDFELDLDSLETKKLRKLQEYITALPKPRQQEYSTPSLCNFDVSSPLRQPGQSFDDPESDDSSDSDSSDSAGI